jgi:valyl-tRNA synthetase
LGAVRDSKLIVAPWPNVAAMPFDVAAAKEMDWVVRLITQVRSIRAEMRVPPGAKVPLLLLNTNAATQVRLANHNDLIVRLARLSSVEIADGELPKGSVQDVIDEATMALPIADVIDVAAEKVRLGKEIAKLDGEIVKFDKKLGNAGFLAKAPAEVVDEERRRRDETAETRARLGQALDRLATVG